MATLEDRLIELIDALKANTAAHRANTAAPAIALAKAEVKAPAPATTEAKKEEPPAPAKTEVKLNKDGEHPDYVPLKAPFVELVQTKGRDAALAVIAPLTALNVIKAGEQHPGQYAEVAGKIKAALAKQEAALV